MLACVCVPFPEGASLSAARAETATRTLDVSDADSPRETFVAVYVGACGAREKSERCDSRVAAVAFAGVEISVAPVLTTEGPGLSIAHRCDTNGTPSGRCESQLVPSRNNRHRACFLRSALSHVDASRSRVWRKKEKEVWRSLQLWRARWPTAKSSSMATACVGLRVLTSQVKALTLSHSASASRVSMVNDARSTVCWLIACRGKTSTITSGASC